MNLIKYNTKGNLCYFYINNINLTAFLSLWQVTQEIKLEAFYGYHVRQTFTEKDFVHPLSIETFLEKIQTYNVTNLNKITLNVNGLTIDIIDAYEYHIASDSNQIFDFGKNVFTKLLKAEFLIQNFEKFEEIYVLVDKGRLIETYQTFDDFLESKYSDEM